MATVNTNAEAPPCPDPSAHHHDDKLASQASTAALLATGARKGDHTRNSSIQSESVLGPDGRLSSKSAATSLKYANAQDLPSFPSSGNVSGGAGKAAMLAKDYKMKELWQPETSLAGSKAAVLAAGKGGKVDLWQASASADGQSAATLAFRNKGLSPEAYGGNSAENKNKALLAATKSTQQSRSRATSSPSAPPELYPDQANSSRNALNAATVSVREGWNSDANQAARVTHLGENVSGKMFTSAPDWQYEEDKHQAALRASAITMAKSLYANQNRDKMLLEPDGSDLAGARSAARNQALAHPDVKQEALQYLSLQDQAHKLAAERLAKIDKDMEGKRFREHYGYGDDKPKRLSSRISLRSSGKESRGRRQRASSEGTRGRFDSDSDSDDERQAGRIRAQMAGLNSATKQVDAKKQQEDRAKLLAAAEKRVSARMNDMDSQVYRDTGKVSPAMMEAWEAKAREKAEKERQERALNPGKTHIGGGQFMDQKDIEAIAAARLKPTLDEISTSAAARRQRDEELRIEKDQQETARMEQKIERQQEKDRQKAVKNELKESAKREKAEEKARKDADKLREKEEQRKSREQKRDTIGSSVVPAGSVDAGRSASIEDERTEETTATDGREKHQSALARLKAKFRTTGSHEKSTDKETANKSAATGVALVGGAAAGATAATLADSDGKDVASQQPLDAQQASYSVAQQDVTTGDSPHEAEWKAGGAAPTAATTTIPSAPIRSDASVSDVDTDDEADDEDVRAARPTFAQTGSVSGFANDSVPTASGSNRMATLERHISNIPDSDGDSSSDEDDWNEERVARPAPTVPDQQPTAVALDSAPVTPGLATYETLNTPREQEPLAASSAATGATGGAAIVTSTETSAEHPPRTLTDVYDENTRALTSDPNVGKSTEAEPPHPANIVSLETTSRLEDQRADPPGPQTPGVVIDTSAPDTASMKAIPPASVTSSPKATGETLKQKIKGEEDLPAIVGAPAQETTTGVATIPAAPTPAPTKEFSKKEAEEAAKASAKSEDKHEKEKDGKGVRGFFSKLRNKSRSEKSPGAITAGTASTYDDSKYDSKTVPYESTKAGDKPTVGATNDGTYNKAATDAAVQQTLAEQKTTAASIPPIDTGDEFNSNTVTTDDTALETAKVRDINEPDSPSSFARGDARATDLDDVSSSGADEDDYARGRGKRSIAKKLGFGRNRDAHVKDGKLHKPPPGEETLHKSSTEAGRLSKSTDDDNDNFEEARDHFDESLAPPPAFAGQAKSQSPVRSTKFKEDV
ncbi:hypothetical protein CB0940_11055 [Cercospora beticola]|uniref:Eisosome protein 1 n=1 Tax=Cercospora beticola TaxID=122368 RepID=A0A2G5HCX4_CERBT|nr:hypothetical protein CB0940_11055 [Cercospora beticola]PIA90414.1 hypothetical protein CB0940_11055 [Cercospora beticola]WPB07884.1 hypothetical protein RHO25_012548 [Cercospora beticola]